MTERERLIELLTQAESKELNLLDFEKKILADYLLKNGVIVPPVKVGDVVYAISRGDIILIQIDTIQYTSKGIDICGSNEECFGYGTVHLDVLNETGFEWYYTKEEAEKALKEIERGETMTERERECERLIEIMLNSRTPLISKPIAKTLADALIENGVIVPPCKCNECSHRCKNTNECTLYGRICTENGYCDRAEKALAEIERG